MGLKSKLKIILIQFLGQAIKMLGGGVTRGPRGAGLKQRLKTAPEPVGIGKLSITGGFLSELRHSLAL